MLARIRSSAGIGNASSGNLNKAKSSSISKTKSKPTLAESASPLPSKAIRFFYYVASFVPEQETLRTLFTPIKGEEWRKSSWKLKSKLLTYYGILFGGLITCIFLWLFHNRRYLFSKPSRKSFLPTVQSFHPSDDHYDICIVGAGVAGSTTAYYCAKYGKRVIVLEKQNLPREKCCAGAITPAAQVHLKEMGVLKEILNENNGHWASSGGFVSPEGHSFIGNAAEHSGSRILVVNRSILDMKIAQAAARESAFIITGSKVKEVCFLKDRGLWQISSIRDGVYQSHFATVLVAADGAYSKIASKLGIVEDEPDMIGSSIISTPMAENQYQSLRADGVCFYPQQLIDLNGYFLMLKHANEVFHMCTFVHGNTSTENIAKINADLINNDPYISQCVGSNVALSPLKNALVRTGGVNNSVADHFICVGDAAGQVDPLTGEGIQYAMDSAKIAATTLTEGFISGDLSETFLMKYQIRWRNRCMSSFSSSRNFLKLVQHFPFVLDAAAIVIRRNGADYLKNWAKAMSGEKSKLGFLRPDFLFAILVEIIYRKAIATGKKIGLLAAS